MVFDIPYLMPLDWDYGAVTSIITYRNLIRSDFPNVNIKHQVLLFNGIPT